MNQEIKKVFDEFRSTSEQLKEYVDKKLDEVRKNGQASADTVESIDKINASITELRSQYDALVADFNRPKFEGSDKDKSPEVQLREQAYTKYLRFGFGDQTRAAFTPEETRALSGASDGNGDFLVPDSYESEIIMQAFDAAEIRPLCNVRPTGRDAVQMPSLSKPTVAWGTKNVAVTEQQLSAGSERIEIFDLKALTLIHNNTLDDAAADVWGELRDAFGMAVAEAEDDAFAAAAGDRMPKGIIADSRVQANYTPTGVAAALSDGSNNGVDALITLLHALKKAYRRNSTWAMNSTVEGTVRQFKDSNGQYLWQPPVIPGNPTTLLGRPIVNPEGLPDVAANAFPIALGDFRSGYKIRDRAGIVIQRLVERYAEYDQTGFLLKKRVGGQVTLPEAFQLLKVATS